MGSVLVRRTVDKFDYKLTLNEDIELFAIDIIHLRERTVFLVDVRF